jgi:ubiquinone/menaquinone biosynthesis C-methylase UbiE
MDVRKRIPFPDSSVSYIYTSHVFHQFTYEESLAIARESFRVLQAGGVIRIVVPDLALRVRTYMASTDDPMASHHLVLPLLPPVGIRDFVHPGTNLRQMFDGRSLTHLLKEAGFASPEVSSFRTSQIPEVDKLDLEVRRRESLYVEAVK